MKLTDSIKRYRNGITIILALAGIGLMIYYDYCDTACRYLKGDIWGIDLKWVGSAYMAAIIVFAAFKQAPFVRALLAAGLGVEIHLYAFQLQNDVYCPFCLAFSVMVIISFIINYEVPSAWRENRRRMWLYFLGEVDLPMFKIHRLPLLIVSILGYLVILFTFSGSATPAYAQDVNKGIPSLGKGNYEVVLFTDYFCPPCQEIEKDAESLIRELLSSGKVKVTFIDVPSHRPTPIFAKYYLYAVNYAGNDWEEILSIRKTLFHAAKTKRIQKEDDLINYLKEMKISWTKFDETPVLQMMNSIIKQNKVDTTPTCIIKNSAGDVKKYIGTDEIRDGLTKLKSHLGALKK
jgi:thiol:disulfide interchange protein DsbA